MANKEIEELIAEVHRLLIEAERPAFQRVREIGEETHRLHLEGATMADKRVQELHFEAESLVSEIDYTGAKIASKRVFELAGQLSSYDEICKERSRELSAYPCPCCGFLTLTEPPGSFLMCPSCPWQDDIVQLTNPFCIGGANGDSLWDVQQEVMDRISRYPEVYKNLDWERHPAWRPLCEADKARYNHDRDSPTDASYTCPPGVPLYYWDWPTPQ